MAICSIIYTAWVEPTPSCRGASSQLKLVPVPIDSLILIQIAEITMDVMIIICKQIHGWDNNSRICFVYRRSNIQLKKFKGIFDNYFFFQTSEIHSYQYHVMGNPGCDQGLRSCARTASRCIWVVSGCLFCATHLPPIIELKFFVVKQAYWQSYW